MTIGIAAHGPNAGLAVMRALAAVEAVGRGAIGGFVSFVALTEKGGAEWRSVQSGGSAALFGAGQHSMPSVLARARNAAVMSSGPNRPEPLCQFTPALEHVGLVTGHRMPNTIGVNGINLADEVLVLMRDGLSPQDAVTRVLMDNPEADAGIIALAVDGRIHAANAPLVARRGDTGLNVVCTSTVSVAVLHNAIRPHQPLAALVTHVALDAMEPPDVPDARITFSRGIPLEAGRETAVLVANDVVKRIFIENPKYLQGRWSLGLGHDTPVLAGSETCGVMLYEPYMVVEDGMLCTVDGRESLTVPMRRIAPETSLPASGDRELPA